ncbi:hypothetical protein QJ850_gp088 [Acanthamoeba polyphaga mimivirus]|uniref:Uncharacterized protein n=1 Tax=Acanthamoeba polyphaga mimivirus Kroon TaxID=3069720 RepID=A0A0G2YC39_9VIRU|nr:hypothetical protein QJ850_gp088 [Acanthamoeba polyphaga mimivirus]AKI80611.1 hypothetical protein [Acanthamoeba polyphaga mimivirus Kroon]
MELDKYYRSVLYESVLSNLDNLDTKSLNKIKKRIDEKIFYESFNKNIPNFIEDKILEINFDSFCEEYYKGTNITATIKLKLINNCKIKTGCIYRSYYDHDGYPVDEDINKFRIGTDDYKYTANIHPDNEQKGIQLHQNNDIQFIYVDDEKNILELNKKKYFERFLDCISIKSTENNIKNFCEFLEYIIETVRETGGLKSLDSKGFNYVYTKK